MPPYEPKVKPLLFTSGCKEELIVLNPGVKLISKSKPSFSNSFNVNYNSFKILSGSYTYLGANYSNQNDAFVQNITTDEESGKSVYRWENLTDKTNQSINIYGGFHFKLNKDLGIENSPRIAVNG